MLEINDTLTIWSSGSLLALAIPCLSRSYADTAMRSQDNKLSSSLKDTKRGPDKFSFEAAQNEHGPGKRQVCFCPIFPIAAIQGHVGHPSNSFVDSGIPICFRDFVNNWNLTDQLSSMNRICFLKKHVPKHKLGA
jgi:hypothetical protein